MGDDARIEARGWYRKKLEFAASIDEHRYELRQRQMLVTLFFLSNLFLLTQIGLKNLWMFLDLFG